MPGPGALRVEVVRSGGFAGLTVAVEVHRDKLDELAQTRLDALLDQLGLGGAADTNADKPTKRPAAPGRSVGADRFDYEVTVRRGRQIRRISLSEGALAPELRQGLEELLGTASAGQ